MEDTTLLEILSSQLSEMKKSYPISTDVRETDSEDGNGKEIVVSIVEKNLFFAETKNKKAFVIKISIPTKTHLSTIVVHIAPAEDLENINNQVGKNGYWNDREEGLEYVSKALDYVKAHLSVLKAERDLADKDPFVDSF